MPVRGDRFSRELNLKTRDLNWQDRFWPVTSVCFIRLRWENREIIKLLPSTKFWSESKMLGITRCKELWTFLCFAPFVFLGSIATTCLRISWFHFTREYSEDGPKFCIFWKTVHPSTATPNMPHYEWHYNPTKDTVSKESSRFIHELLIQDPTFLIFLNI